MLVALQCVFKRNSLEKTVSNRSHLLFTSSCFWAELGVWLMNVHTVLLWIFAPFPRAVISSERTSFHLFLRSESDSELRQNLFSLGLNLADVNGCRQLNSWTLQSSDSELPVSVGCLVIGQLFLVSDLMAWQTTLFQEPKKLQRTKCCRLIVKLRRKKMIPKLT